MRGYYVSYGYMGYMPHKGYVLFATIDEYVEAYNEATY